MELSFLVAQRLDAAESAIFALKLHRVKLFFNLFADVNEAWLLALEGTLPGLFGEFVQAHLVEPVLAFLALPGVLEDSRAESAKELSRDLVLAHYVTLVEGKAHATEVILGTPSRTECLCS